MKDKVRPLYGELMGYLSQAPSLQQSSYLRDPSLAPQLHSCIDQLNQITGKDYNRFRVTVHPSDMGGYVQNTEYRSKLNGLIMNLHAQYFDDESSPFSGTPTTIVNQSQNQSMQAQIVMITEFQSFIDKQLYGNTANLDGKQKTFLEKLKRTLPTLKSAADLVATVVTIGKSLGLDISQITKALGI